MKFLDQIRQEINEEIEREVKAAERRTIVVVMDYLTEIMFRVVEYHPLDKNIGMLSTEQIMESIQVNLNFQLDKDKWRAIINSLPRARIGIPFTEFK